LEIKGRSLLGLEQEVLEEPLEHLARSPHPQQQHHLLEETAQRGEQRRSVALSACRVAEEEMAEV
jgi:hypothetical protein